MTDRQAGAISSAIAIGLLSIAWVMAVSNEILWMSWFFGIMWVWTYVVMLFGR